MSSDSESSHSKSRRSYSGERDKNRSRRNRSKDRESKRNRDSNDRKRHRSRSRERNRDYRDRDRDEDRERERERESTRNKDKEEGKKKKEIDIKENENDYKNKKQRIENTGNEKQDNKSKDEEGEEKKKIEKEKPNFKLTGKLAAEANTYNGVVLKYSEPPEARKTTVKWRFHIFKGDKQLEPLPVYHQSGYLLGRDRLVADIPIDHPSCSKQHAVLQYRQVQGTDKNGDPAMVIKPYLIDLNSSNGTFINGEKIEPSRYYELKQADVIKFGFSTRDYIFIDENSA